MSTGPRDTRGRFRRRSKITARMRWFDQRMLSNIRFGMRARIKFAAQLLRDEVVYNVSQPVFKYKGKSGRVQVDPSSRSRPGQFPKADTTRLMKDVFWQMDGDLSAQVGTTLDYGLLLETRMDRSFLRRTLHETHAQIRRILVTDQRGPLPGQE